MSVRIANSIKCQPCLSARSQGQYTRSHLNWMVSLLCSIDASRIMVSLTTVLSTTAAAAATALADFVPIHGCEWVPSSTAIKDFVFLTGASNTSTISWNAPTVSAFCKTANATPTLIGGYAYSVPCSPPENGITYDILRVSEDDTTATMMFRAFAQCAADIYAFHYEATFSLNCAKVSENTSCTADGDVVAICTSEEYLPPIRNPPPPCYSCGRRE